MQSFKRINELLKPDPAMEFYSHLDLASGMFVPQDTTRIHERVNEYSLGNHVPTQIRSYFDTSRNLMVFSYYEYGFVPVAAFLAISAVEMALRTIYPQENDDQKSGNDKRSFKLLLRRAITDGRLQESEFKTLAADRAKHRLIVEEFARLKGVEIAVTQEPYEKVFLRTAPTIRNMFAHPNVDHTLFPPEMAFNIMKRAAEALNQLFKERDEPTEEQ